MAINSFEDLVGRVDAGQQTFSTEELTSAVKFLVGALSAQTTIIKTLERKLERFEEKERREQLTGGPKPGQGGSIMG